MADPGGPGDPEPLNAPIALQTVKEFIRLRALELEGGMVTSKKKFVKDANNKL